MNKGSQRVAKGYNCTHRYKLYIFVNPNLFMMHKEVLWYQSIAVAVNDDH